MERIGLIQVDGKYSLPLMKISAFHKSIGDHVEWANPLLKYDKVYIAKIFDFTPDFNTCLQSDEIIKGGTGYDLKNKLPKQIENIYPDYSLYNSNVAYGFLTRGCPRNCDFCIVTQKEGQCSVKVSDLHGFWKDQKEIKLLDPNLLACKDRLDLLDQLIHSGAYVDFTQGLDIRLMNDEIINKIKQIKLKVVHFAWDQEKNSKNILDNLQHFKEETQINIRKAKVYVLTNYNTDFDFDLYRVYKLRELGFDPYIMIYDKYNAPRQVRLLQRWVNNKILFRVCHRFEDYNPKLA